MRGLSPFGRLYGRRENRQKEELHLRRKGKEGEGPDLVRRDDPTKNGRKRSVVKARW